MPNLGIIASSNQQGRGGGPVSAFDALASITLTSATSTVVFAGIPSGYKHLQLRTMNLSTGLNNNIILRFNNDSGANYSEHAMVGSGASASAYAGANVTYCSAGYTATSNYPGASICDILDYSSTVKNKTVRAMSSNEDNNSDCYITFQSSAWYNLSAISRIEIVHGNIAGGKVFNPYTQFALYGVK